MKILKKTSLYIVVFIASLFLSCDTKPSVTEHGIFAPSRHRYVLGQDGVCSIQFSDKITLWTFADTVTGKWKNGKGPVTSLKNDTEMEGMLSNSIAWSRKITSKNFRNIELSFITDEGKVTQFIKNREDEDPRYHRFWALDGVRIKNRVYVWYLHVFVPDYRKMLEFRVLYSGLAVWDIPEGWKPGAPVQFRRLGRFFGGEYPAFGASAMVREGYVYLAGHFKKDDRFPLSFARVRENMVEDPGAYEFLSGEGAWQKKIGKAGAFFGDVSGECSLSYNRSLGRYLVVYSRVFTGEVAASAFSDFKDIPSASSVTVYTPSKKGDAPIWPYSAKEIFSEGRRVFVIYIDPVLYQPLLLELRF